MTPQKKSSETAQPTWEYDPFAEPRTIPTGWDMSEFLKSAEVDARPLDAPMAGETEKDGLSS